MQRSDKLDGYHTFFTHAGTRNTQYWPLDALAQLTSALFWKHNFGPIHLSCDNRHLLALRQYGVEKVYDSVDTTLMERIPPVDERYWAFSKIAMAAEVVKTKQRFAIVDTDLWLKRVPPTWEPSSDVQCLHYENYDLDYEHNPYLMPTEFLEWEETGYHWDSLPLNCALTYLNSPQLVARWHQLASHAIQKNTHKPPMGNAREMVFIEQRILSEVAAGMGAKVTTIIPSVFQTQIPVGIPGLPPPWVPTFNSSPLLMEIEGCVRHIWGMKKEYSDVNVRRSVAHTIYRDVDEVLGADAFDGYDRLIGDVNALLQP